MGVLDASLAGQLEGIFLADLASSSEIVLPGRRPTAQGGRAGAAPHTSRTPGDAVGTRGQACGALRGDDGSRDRVETVAARPVGEGGCIVQRRIGGSPHTRPRGSDDPRYRRDHRDLICGVGGLLSVRVRLGVSFGACLAWERDGVQGGVAPLPGSGSDPPASEDQKD